MKWADAGSTAEIGLRDKTREKRRLGDDDGRSLRRERGECALGLGQSELRSNKRLRSGIVGSSFVYVQRDVTRIHLCDGAQLVLQRRDDRGAGIGGRAHRAVRMDSRKVLGRDARLHEILKRVTLVLRDCVSPKRGRCSGGIVRGSLRSRVGGGLQIFDLVLGDGELAGKGTIADSGKERGKKEHAGGDCDDASGDQTIGPRFGAGKDYRRGRGRTPALYCVRSYCLRSSTAPCAFSFFISSVHSARITRLVASPVFASCSLSNGRR